MKALRSETKSGVSKPCPASRADLYRGLRDEFRDHAIPTAELDARVLVCAGAEISLEEFVLNPDEPVDKKGETNVSNFKTRRLSGEPIARILEQQEFWSMNFIVNDETLVPRPDTEILVETAIRLLRQSEIKSPHIADLGTGSGCILISILTEIPDAVGHGIDISEPAIQAARQNAELIGVSNRTRFSQGSWCDPLLQPVDLIVSNPPYIPSGDIQWLAREVSVYDPRAALDGGQDGLDGYRQIGRAVFDKMKDEAKLVLEIGYGQIEPVIAIMRSYGLMLVADAGIQKDLSGIARVVAFRKSL